MELNFVILVIVIVIVVALGLAFVSNRAEQPRQLDDRRKQRTPRTKEPKTRTRTRGAKKAVKDVRFGSVDGRVENEDESMVELIQGTMKQAAQDAKDEAKKRLQSAKNEVKNVSKTATKKAKNAAAAVSAALDVEDDSEYVEVKPKARKPKSEESTINADSSQQTGKGRKPRKDGTDAAAAESNEDATSPVERRRERKKNSAFFKSEVPVAPERKPGDRPPRQPRADGTFAPREPREFREPREPREPRQPREPREPRTDGLPEDGVISEERRDRRSRRDGDNMEQDGDRPRQPREPREPRKPREIQQIPVPLSAGAADAPSLDDMLGAISNFYGTTSSKNFFSGMKREILIRIISLLSVKDIATLSQVNHFLSKFTRDDAIWKSLCVRDFNLNFGKKSERKKFKPIYRDEFEKLHGKKQSSGRRAKSDLTITNLAPATVTATATTDDAPATNEIAPIVQSEDTNVTGSPSDKKVRKPREKKSKDV